MEADQTAAAPAALHPDAIVIERLGGSTATSRLCGGRASSQSVSYWKRKGIPPGWRAYLNLLRPRAFDGVADKIAEAANDSE